MRPLLTLLLLFTLASLSAQNWGNRKQVRGNGDMVKQDREVRNFDEVVACCSMDVELRRGDFKVVVEAESNLQEFIRTDVSGGRLKIGYKSNVNIRESRPVRVYVTLPEISYVRASSSSKVEGKDAFRGDELEVTVSSSAKIELEFTGKFVDADASSSGHIYLSGSADRMTADASSSGKIRAGDLEVVSADADASSGSGITVNVSTELEADANSGASIRYVGSPTRLNSDTSSGGSVRRKN